MTEIVGYYNGKLRRYNENKTTKIHFQGLIRKFPAYGIILILCHPPLQVSSNRRAGWDFVGFQVPIGSSVASSLAVLGINISAGSTQSEIFLTVDRSGREVYNNRDLQVACTALTTVPVLDFETSCFYYIRTYGEYSIMIIMVNMCLSMLPCTCYMGHTKGVRLELTI